MTKALLKKSVFLFVSLCLLSHAWAMESKTSHEGKDGGEGKHLPSIGRLSLPLQHQLLTYAQTGDLEQLKALGVSPTTVETCDEEGRSLLEHASYKGHTPVVRWLLDNGASARHQDARGITPLHMAVQEGHYAVAELLAPLSNINHKDNRGVSALHLATQKRHEEIALLLCHYPHSIDLSTEDGKTALWMACTTGQVRLVDAFLKERHASVQIRERQKISPLLAASYQGHTPIVALLLDNGKADPNVPRDNGVTPLVAAAFKGFLPIVQRLVQAGASLGYRVPETQGTALQYAQYAGRTDVVAFLEAKLAEENDKQQAAVLHQQDQQIIDLKKQIEDCLEEERKAQQALLQRQHDQHMTDLKRHQDLLDGERNARQALEQRLQKILADHEAEEMKAGAIRVLREHPDLGQFYHLFKRKLSSLFLAYQVLDTGRVVRQQGRGVFTATHGLTLLGSVIPLPGVTLATSAVSAAITYWDDRRAERKIRPMADLFDSLVILDEEVEKASRLMTERYAEQIEALTETGIADLVDCGIARFVSHMGGKNFNANDDLLTQCRKALELTESFQGMFPFTHRPIQTKQNKNWTDRGIFQHTGIKTTSGHRFMKPSISKADKYGYRLGTEEEAIEGGYSSEL